MVFARLARASANLGQVGAWHPACSITHVGAVPIMPDGFSARRAIARMRLAAGTIVVALILVCEVAQASEYGVGTYRPGQVDLFAGVLPAPGTFLVRDYFLFENANLGARPVNAPLQVHSHTITYTDANVCRLHDAVADFRRELGGCGDRADAHRRSDLARHAQRRAGVQ